MSGGERSSREREWQAKGLRQEHAVCLRNSRALLRLQGGWGGEPLRSLGPDVRGGPGLPETTARDSWAALRL